MKTILALATSLCVTCGSTPAFAGTNQVATWLLSAVSAWGGMVPAAEREHTLAFRQQLVEDVASVAFDPAEPPRYAGPYGRSLTALALLSITALETRFRERIMLGHCKTHECDGGHAVGLMQAHPGDHGLRLLGTKAEQCLSDDDDCLTAGDLVEGGAMLQFRVGLHIWRAQGIEAYSPGPAAIEQATAWALKHRPPVTDADVIGL